VLSAELARPRIRGGVTLIGDAARDVRDTLGTAVVESAKVGQRAMESTRWYVRSLMPAARATSVWAWPRLSRIAARFVVPVVRERGRPSL
jgi:hypothetical protein